MPTRSMAAPPRRMTRPRVQPAEGQLVCQMCVGTDQGLKPESAPTFPKNISEVHDTSVAHASSVGVGCHQYLMTSKPFRSVAASDAEESSHCQGWGKWQAYSSERLVFAPVRSPVKRKARKCSTDLAWRGMHWWASMHRQSGGGGRCRQ